MSDMKGGGEVRHAKDTLLISLNEVHECVAVLQQVCVICSESCFLQFLSVLRLRQHTYYIYI